MWRKIKVIIIIPNVNFKQIPVIIYQNQNKEEIKSPAVSTDRSVFVF